MAFAHAHLNLYEALTFAPTLPPNKKMKAKVAHSFLNTFW